VVSRLIRPLLPLLFRAARRQLRRAPRIRPAAPVERQRRRQHRGRRRQPFRHPRAEGVILAIDSPGGHPAEAQRISDEIVRLREQTKKPVVAVIGNVGASAAYLIALRADRIYVSQYSLVGSIGAVMAGWDLHRAAERLAIARRAYASGELKTMLDPFQPMTVGAEAKARALVAGVGELFANDVRLFRKDTLASNLRIESGELWYGADAVKLGLADAVASLETVAERHWPSRSLHDFSAKRSGSLNILGSVSDSLASALIDRFIRLATLQLQ
jgi:protease-4